MPRKTLVGVLTMLAGVVFASLAVAGIIPGSGSDAPSEVRITSSGDDASPEPAETPEPTESPEPTETPEADDEGASGTIVSFDGSSGILTVSTTGGDVSGTVTGSTELEWESSGSGPGECEGREDATTTDLEPGTAVSEMEFVDGTDALEGVELVCPGERRAEDADDDPEDDEDEDEEDENESPEPTGSPEAEDD